MSEYEKISEKIDQMAIDLATIKERLVDYSNNKAKIAEHSKLIDIIYRRCAAIQAEKSEKSVQPGALKTGIIIGIIVGAAVGIINVVINHYV